MSIQQYHRMDSYVFDLGFFESVIRDYAHGHLPELPLTDTTVATLHFSPALALLAPVVWIWPSPIAVLVAQAVLVAAGVVPLMRVGRARLDGLGGRGELRPRPGFGALFGFDFHEVALAVPLLAFSMAAMVRGEHRAAVLWALPLVLVKEDLGLTVAALGLVVFLRGLAPLGRRSRWSFGARRVRRAGALAAARRRAPAASPRASRRTALGTPGGSSAKERTTSSARCCSCCCRPACSRCARRCSCSWRCRPSAGGSSPTATPTGTPGTSTTPCWCPIAVAAMIEGAVLLRGRVRQVGLAPRRRRHAGRCCRSSTSRSSRSGTPTSGARRPGPPPSTGCSTRSRTAVRVAASDDLGSRIALRTDLYLIGDTIGPDGPPLPPSDFDEVEWIALDTRIAPAPVPAWRGFVALLDSGEFEVVAAGRRSHRRPPET